MIKRIILSIRDFNYTYVSIELDLFSIKMYNPFGYITII